MQRYIDAAIDGDVALLREAFLPTACPSYLAAVTEGRTEESGVFVGEAIGLMKEVLPVPEILVRVSGEAEELLSRRAPRFVS